MKIFFILLLILGGLSPKVISQPQLEYGLATDIIRTSRHPSALSSNWGFSIVNTWRLRNQKESSLSYIGQFTFSKQNILNSCITFEEPTFPTDISSPFRLDRNNSNCEYRVDRDNFRLTTSLGIGLSIINSLISKYS